MERLSHQFVLRLATEEDGKAILNIYECEDFKGKISVLYTRRPNPYLSLLNEGEQVVMPVIEDIETGTLCAVGCCVIRSAYMQNEIKKVGYLTGLKILPEYRKRIPYIAKVYRYLYEQTKDLVDYYYTTILIENIPVQKMLEKKRKNMPIYDFKGIYTVYCFKTGKKVKSLQEYRLNCGDQQQAIDFYKKHGKNRDLFSADLDLGNFPKDAIYTLVDNHNQVIAACIIYNQQGYKQYIITQYRGIYRMLQHIKLNWLGYPNFPKANEVINYAAYHMLCVKDDAMNIGDYFIRKIAEKEKKYDFLMMGLFETHPYNQLMNKIKHIKYQSKFYCVKWEQEDSGLDDNRLYIDVGLL